MMVTIITGLSALGTIPMCKLGAAYDGVRS